MIAKITNHTNKSHIWFMRHLLAAKYSKATRSILMASTIYQYAESIDKSNIIDPSVQQLLLSYVINLKQIKSADQVKMIGHPIEIIFHCSFPVASTLLKVAASHIENGIKTIFYTFFIGITEQCQFGDGLVLHLLCQSDNQLSVLSRVVYSRS